MSETDFKKKGKRQGLSQEQMIADLKSPDSYPYTVKQIDLIQTHISIVSLIADYVYKIKKPVNLGFLDFSTLEKRREQCDKEVRLNRRLSKNMYEGVVPISRVDDSLKIEDDSNIVEYAVKMKRLSEDGFLDRKVEKGDLDKKDIERVVGVLKKFYGSQKSSAEAAEWGKPQNLMISIKENFEQTARFQGELLKESVFKTIQSFQKQFISCHFRLMNRRRAEGNIIDGHGDLRLEHIHFTSDEVRIFDCIEFNDRFRYNDTANEVAFLAMDLDYHDRSDLADYFIQRMSEALEDPDLPELIDFYRNYRAYVRAKVQSLKILESEISEQQKKTSRKAAIDLYRLALNYSLNGLKPTVIVIMGTIGTGKTTIAQNLSEALGWEVVRSDRERKLMEGVPLKERPATAERKKLYSREMTEKTYAVLKNKAVQKIKNGESCLLDATYGKKHLRYDLQKTLIAHRIPYFFIELSAGEEAIKKRLRDRESSPEQISDARIEDFPKLRKMYEPPDALEDARHFIVDSQQSMEETLYDILNGVILLRDVNT